jgi:hypothetical protein
VTGHDAVKEAARNHGRWSSGHQGDEDVRDYRQLPLEADPPEHTLIRAALAPLFVRGVVEGHRAAIHADAAALLAPLGAGDAVELVDDVGLPLAVRTIARLLDIDADAPRLLAFGLSVWGDHEGRRDGTAFHAYLDELVDRAARGEAGRVLGALATTPVGARPLDRAAQIGIASLLLAAGRDTVVGMIAGIGWGLVTRPDLLPALLAAGPGGGPSERLDARGRFIEEVLRLTVGLVMERIDRGPEGLPIDRAPHVALDFPSANHDPSAFPSPAEIRLDRPNATAHVAFGLGAHACIGAPLARLEGRVVFDALLAAAPGGLVLDPEAGDAALVADLRPIDGVMVPSGIRRLMVRGAPHRSGGANE